MRMFPTFITTLVSIAIVALQLGGLHLHASTTDHDIDLHVAMAPSHEAADHEHSAHGQLEVSLTDAAMLGDGKFKPAFMAGFSLPGLSRAGTAQSRPAAPPRLGGPSRVPRWRPPLRAPPTLS